MEIIKNGRILDINDARIVYRNFSGAAGKYNREGDRNFAVVIPSEEIKEELVADGWNVKIRPPRDEFEDPFMFLPVKVKFNDRGPSVYVRSGNSIGRLNEETVGMLDEIDILGVNMTLRASNWEVNGKTGTSAYLQAIEVIQNVDRFRAQYDEQGLLD